MRNLTLCVLLAIVGTLAALPFRKHNPPGIDAPIASEATGPTISELGNTNLDRFVESDQPIKLDAFIPDGLPKWTVPDVAASLPPIPGSFEEAAVPLRMTDQDKERLSVSATKQLKHQAAGPSTHDSLAFANSRFTRIPLDTTKAKETANTTLASVGGPTTNGPASNGSLGSGSLGNGSLGNGPTGLPSESIHHGSIERLPKPPSNQRKRFWIRQPD